MFLALSNFPQGNGRVREGIKQEQERLEDKIGLAVSKREKPKIMTKLR